jgi:hypothetical protein
MALRGSLEDVGIVDLVQFLLNGHKSGVLIIASPEDDAKLYCDAGSLVHATVGETEGSDALKYLLDWREGEFEFRPGQAAPERRSVTADLHHTVMQAVQRRGELKSRGAATDAVNKSKVMEKKFKEFIKAFPFTSYVGAIGSDGKAFVEAVNPTFAPEAVDSLKWFVKRIIAAEPRQGFRRMFIEDDLGTVVISKLGRESLLLVVVRESATLGAASMAVTRFSASLSASADDE